MPLFILSKFRWPKQIAKNQRLKSQPFVCRENLDSFDFCLQQISFPISHFLQHLSICKVLSIYIQSTNLSFPPHVWAAWCLTSGQFFHIEWTSCSPISSSLLWQPCSQLCMKGLICVQKGVHRRWLRDEGSRSLTPAM